MKCFAIYTALVGSYDTIQQPLISDPRFDYILFTDNLTESNIGIWQARQIDYDNPDKTRIAHYVKTHPEVLLADYKATLWIDANLQITTDYLYQRIVELDAQNVQLASIYHPYRQCVYDEAYSVYGLDKEQTIFNWCHYLRSMNYPCKNGLYETNVLFRRQDDETRQVDEQWWNIINAYSRRDQLSLNYVLYINSIRQDFILPKGEHVDNSINIRKISHSNNAKQQGRRGVRESFWEHARTRCRSGMEEKEGQFREFHYWLYGLNPVIARMLLHLWGVYATIVYGAIIKLRASKQNITR